MTCPPRSASAPSARSGQDGPFDLGAPPYKALAIVAVLGVVLLAWIGVQPPNDKALGALIAAIAVLCTSWWLGVNKRFQGPPKVSLIAEK